MKPLHRATRVQDTVCPVDPGFDILGSEGMREEGIAVKFSELLGRIAGIPYMVSYFPTKYNR